MIYGKNNICIHFIFPNLPKYVLLQQEGTNTEGFQKLITMPSEGLQRRVPRKLLSFHDKIYLI